LLDSLLQEKKLKMAEMLPKKDQVMNCDNCCYYGWEQPEDRATIQRCGRCKVATYCSKQCQEEHWHNVHKKHCKYMAKLKVLPMSWHDEAACLVCKEMTAAGIELTKPGNPVWACPLSLVNQAQMNDFLSETPLPFPLAEMTGQFMSKAEAIVTIMMRLLLKMKLVNHTAWSIKEEQAQKLYHALGDARYMCWSGYAIANPGPRLDRVLMDSLGTLTLRISDLINQIDCVLKSGRFEDQDEFRQWDSLLILASFLMLLRTDLNRNTAEHLGLSDMCGNLLEIRVTSSQFNDLLQKILDKMSCRLVPYLTLIEVLCGGKLEQTCFECSEMASVSDVFLVGGGCRRIVEDDKKSVLLLGNITLILCGRCKYDCLNCVELRDTEELFCLEYTRQAFEFGGDCCDYCGLHYKGSRGHRCSRCLTKLYCGEPCRNQDWGVHKLVCREGEEGRKRKGGKKDRKQKGSDQFKGFVTFLDQKWKMEYPQ